MDWRRRSVTQTAAVTAGHVVSIALIFVPALVAAQPALFTDLADVAVERRGRTAEPASEMPVALRSRPVGISLRQLAAARASVADGGSRLTLNLFDDAVFTATLEHSGQTARGYSLAGTLDADPLSSVVLVVNGDVVAGAIRTLQGVYRIRTVSPGVHEVREVAPSLDRFAEPPESPGFVEDGTFSRAGDGLAPHGPEDGSVVDVLVAYTPAARAAEGGRHEMEALIDLMVAQTNQAFMYSHVDSRLNLVHTVKVDYVVAEHPDVECLECILTHPSDGYLDELHAMRDRYAADLVALIVTHPYPYGGEANSWWFRRLPNDDPSRYGFSVTRSDVPAAFTHEIGHNMGLSHDRYAEFYDCCTVRNGFHWNSPHPYSYGYVNQRALEPEAPVTSRWGTIMSYGTQCRDAGFHCSHLLRFSNSDVLFNGDPMGIPGDAPSWGPTGPADARRTLNETRTIVANFRIAPCRAGAQDSVACDRRALEALYDATSGPRWMNSTNWKTEAPLARWHGVTTDGMGRITRLDLAGNGLAGRLPLDVTSLSKLTYLDISRTAACMPPDPVFQAWRAAIPTFRGRICVDPAAVDRAALEALFDSTGGANWTHKTNWKTEAPLDQWYGVWSFGRVTVLELPNNGLAGPVPNVLGDLAGVTKLWLGGNALTGPIPTTLGRLANLEYLNLGGNELRGPIPTELGRLDNLKGLWLWGNRLTGPIPAELGILTNLEWLYLGGNGLTGPVPQALTRLSNLRAFDISGTAACFPANAAFQTWLKGIEMSYGRTCAPDVVTSGETIRAARLSALRSDANRLLAVCGDPPASWTDDPIERGVTPMKAIHVTELRTAIEDAYRACSRTPPTWTDDPLVRSETPVRAVHFNEMRTALQAALP